MLRRLALLAVLLFPASASAAEFAPPDTPGPPLQITAKQLGDVLQCSKGIDQATRAPVLLFQGTGATAKDNWSWTYEPAFDMAGIPWCTVDTPEHATGDIQLAAEYVVAAIREVHRRAGRKVSLVGHSQGGMVPRWALRWWPDTRAMVDDVIGFAPSNHGSTAGGGCSAADPCSAAGWQQQAGATFIAALNSSAETWPGIDYTVAYTRTDETVQPNMDATGSSSLRTGGGRISNVMTQSICPADVYEHLMIGTVDAVAHALAIDALDHDGPADPKRIDPLSVCGLVYHRGVNTLTAPNDAAMAVASFESYQPKLVASEPPLACYVTASCPTAAAAAAKKPCVSKRRFTVRVPRGRKATLDGKRLEVRGGRAVVDLRGRPRGTVSVRVGSKVRRFRTCG